MDAIETEQVGRVRLSVRQFIYRDVPGFSVTGRDALGRSVRIFCRRESTARAIVAAYKAGDDSDAVDRLLRADT